MGTIRGGMGWPRAGSRGPRVGASTQPGPTNAIVYASRFSTRRRDAQQIFFRYGLDGRRVCQVRVGAEAVEAVESELRSVSGVSLLVDGVVAREVAPGACEFVVGHRLADQTLQFAKHALLGLVDFLGGGGDVDREEAGGHAFDVDRVHRIGQAAAVAEFEEQAPP